MMSKPVSAEDVSSLNTEIIEKLWNSRSSSAEVPFLRDPPLSVFTIFERLKGEITSLLQNLCIPQW